MASTSQDQPARLPGLSLVTKPDRPCDLCRRRKVKCFLDVGDTSCARCRTGGQACTFEEQPQKRPRRMLSAAQEPTNTSHVAYPDQARQSPNGVPISSSSTGDIAGGAQTGGGSAPIRTTSFQNPPIYTPTSMPSAELPDDNSHLDVGPTLNLYNDATVEHVGPSADFGPDYLSRVEATASPSGLSTFKTNSASLPDAKFEKERRTTITQDEGPDAVHFKIVSTDESRMTSVHTRVNFPDYDAHVDLPAVLRTIRQNAIQLVDLYIRVVHPSYPIINPLRVVQWLGPALRPNHDINHRDIAVFPLVASQMLVAYHWRNFAPTTLTDIDLSVLRTYLDQAVERELERPRLVTVQSLLLRNSILASTLESKNMFRVWNSMGVLVTTAQNLGLHRSPETWNINSWEMQLRKRLWWAIFTTEKWLAYSIGRSSLIHENEWTVKPLTSADFENYTTPTARFVAMTELTCILSEIHIQLFTPKTTAQLTTDFPKSKGICKPLFSKLEYWRSKHNGLFPLSSQHEHDNSADSADDLQTPAMLQLAHFSAKVALHRALMRCGAAADASVRHDAVQTMQDIGSWAKRLTSQDILSVWWSAASLQFVAVTNFFLGLVFTSPKEEEFRMLQKILQGWRWQLRMHLQLFPALVRSALQRIDELFKEGDQMEAIWKSHRMPTPAMGNTRPNSPKHPTSAAAPSSHAMWDLARLATEANGSAPTFQSMQSLMPSQTSIAQGFNFNVASTPSNVTSNPSYLTTPGDPLTNLFNLPTNSAGSAAEHAFQFSSGLDFNTETGATDFSLEDFMSWSNLNAFTTDDGSRNLQGQDWAL